MSEIKKLYMRQPDIYTYTSYGTLFSIMDEDTWPWVYNNFIQIRYAYLWKMMVFDQHHLILSNCPALDYYIVPREIIEDKWNHSMKDVIKDAIDRDYYLYIYIDRYCISTYKESAHKPHEILIYGYNMEDGIIYCADNIQHGKFDIFESTIEELEEAYWQVHREYSFLTDVRFLKVRHNVHCSINKKQISDSLKRYLNSVTIIDLLEEQKFEFGMNAIKWLLGELKQTNRKYYDIRAFHFLYEHKLLMCKRIEYLMQNGYIKEDKLFKEEFEKLMEDYLILRGMVLKYNIKNDLRIIERANKTLEVLIETEQPLIEQLIERLEE